MSSSDEAMPKKFENMKSEPEVINMANRMTMQARTVEAFVNRFGDDEKKK